MSWWRSPQSMIPPGPVVQTAAEVLWNVLAFLAIGVVVWELLVY